MDTNMSSNLNNNMSINPTTMDMSKLPMMALDNIPVPNADAKNIVALVKESGRVTGYQLSDGRVLGKEEGVNLAKQGGINGVGVASRNGNEYLKSLPDGSENNNLSNLPSISSSSTNNNNEQFK